MARTTLIYPKIPGSNAAPLAQCIAFEKYDGTNLHWAWDCELGWHAFGTRRDRFDLDDCGIKEFAGAHPELESAARLFRQSLERPLTAVLRDQNCFNSSQIVAFTEFLGASSFAGRHREAEEKRLVLFDIQTEQGMLAPDLFVEHLDALPIARTVYRGRLTGKFATDVREGRFEVAEGVVCKGGETGSVWMVKIKTNSYMERLKEAFAADWESHWE